MSKGRRSGTKRLAFASEKYDNDNKVQHQAIPERENDACTRVRKAPIEENMPVIAMALHKVISYAVLIEQRNSCFVRRMRDLPCHTEPL